MDEEEWSELIQKLFYVLTAREDAAGIAAEGQGLGLGNELLVAHANRIFSVSREVAIIAQAVTMLVKK
jgi:hypothetical protein